MTGDSGQVDPLGYVIGFFYFYNAITHTSGILTMYKFQKLSSMK